MRRQLGAPVMTTAMLVIILGIWFVWPFTGAPIYLTMALAGTAFVFVEGINPNAIPQKITKAADSLALLAVLLAIFVWPSLTTWLPSQMQ